MRLKGKYDPGEEYEFYRDIKQIVRSVNKSVFIIDPYMNAELFDDYVGVINRTVQIKLLTNNVAKDLLSVAQKYASGGNLLLRSSNAIHDRVIFVDQRVWLIGQSLKDAAKKKPTYIVEHDAALMLPIYDDIWQKAQIVI